MQHLNLPLVNSEQKDPEVKIDRSSSDHNLKTVKEFKPGDILLFLPPREGMNCAQKLICCAQALQKRQHGHQEVTHAAIFVGYEKNTPKIADVTGKGFRIGKLKENQPVLIFRANNPTLNNEMARIAKSVQGTHFRWNCCVALCMLGKKPAAQPEKKEIEIAKSTTCSRFAIQVQQKALLVLDEKEREKFLLPLEDMSTPKTLESVLHENPNYAMYISLSRKNSIEGTAYEVIKKEVEAQLVRLQIKRSEKYTSAHQVYAAAIQVLDKANLDDIEKAIQLYEQMKRVFAINTGCGFKTTSKNALNESMRRTNLFKSVVNKYKQTLAQEIVTERAEKKTVGNKHYARLSV